MPRWFAANLYRFTFYPGAPIYERAVADGLIDRNPEVYSSKEFWPFFYKGYHYMIHVLILVAGANYILPDWLKRLLAGRTARRIGNRIPQKLLDMIPWDSLYRKLWRVNQEATYKGREIKHY